MSLQKLNSALLKEIAALDDEGRAKAPERVIVGYVPATGERVAMTASASAAGPSRNSINWSEISGLL